MITVNKQSLTSLLAGMLADPSRLKDTHILSITLDSRKVQMGGLFLSLGQDVGQRISYLQQATSLGVAVVLYDQVHDLTADEISLLEKDNIAAYAVRDLAGKAGEIAARFYGHPSLALTVIAVTGTNGKTSVSQFIAQSLEALDIPCGIVGTLGVGRINTLNTTGMTTPDPISLQGILADFCQQNIKYAVIEASSHALEQGRLNSITIDVAVLTNLTRDHLDYHGNMDNYAAAKARLFKFPSITSAIINGDDDFGQDLIAELSGLDDLTVWEYSRKNKAADFYAENCQTSQQGVQFDVRSEFGTSIVKSSLLGQFNIDNLLATMASLLAIDIPLEKVNGVIGACRSVDGRMQAYGSELQTQVVIDFAHTPDALMQALLSLRDHISDKGQLWCVFGCGGDRDSGKRAAMGRSAELYADKVVLTDDNPRGEEATTIVGDILEGIESPENIYIEHDRKLAISYAISQATSDDIVLLAGKGHEKYQEVAGVQHPYSDAEVVIVLLAANDTHSHNMRAGL